MALAAETGFPAPKELRTRHPDRVVMFNVEVNDRCAFSRRCGDICILNQLGSGKRAELSDHVWRELVEELFSCGTSLENVALVGKEPTETPERLEALLGAFHRSGDFDRPLRVGMITSGYQLDRTSGLFRQFPLDWMTMSIDAPETGLRTGGQPESALGAAIDLKLSGGVRELGVASVMDPQNLSGLEKIAKLVMMEKEIDHWSLTPMLRGRAGKLQRVLEFDALQELVSRLIHQFRSQPKAILLNLDYHDLAKMVGRGGVVQDGLDFWRVEHPVPGSNMKLVSMNPRPGYFLRLRYDGQLVDRSEFLGGVVSGRFGKFSKGKLRSALNQMAGEQTNEMAIRNCA
jgi:hypothetical protein